jgi:hypothetical protein
MGEMKSVYSILVGKPEGKGLLGRSKRRWEYNIRKDLREIVWECMDWMQLAQDVDSWRAVVNTRMNRWVPEKEGNFLIRR